MKVVILAGGYGTRLSEETIIKPKPMVEIGNKPILWHIMKIYSYFGFNEFIIACGYKCEFIKKYFLDYDYLNNDFCIDLSNGNIEIYNSSNENWKVHIIDTGLNTQTGGRIKKLEKYLFNQRFMVTYGDGLANINVNELIKFHNKNKKIATITAVRPPSRFGGLNFKGNLIEEFIEKPQITKGWINGGFMVFESRIFKYINSYDDILEVDVMEKLAKDKELVGYKHKGFWQPMDTIREKNILEDLWKNNKAYWKVW
ncbi:MAG: glucose-1-phosphate cytidylyltransferase [Candidatus Sericytochromatia bacterium]|nr:MAG: glucose-1-phosphate cytidylyltransferase [Candidatus Sericytochromatia bacterium]